MNFEIEQRLKNLEIRQNILEHIIKVIFTLFKSKIDNSVRIQIEKALLSLADLKPALQKETANVNS